MRWTEISELDDDAQRLIEIVLATNESLVAYRRRYRSDVEFVAAVELVVSDPSNPRSAAYAIATVRDEVGRLGWTDGEKLSSELFDQLQQSRLHTPAATARVLDDLYDGCDRLGSRPGQQVPGIAGRPAGDGRAGMSDRRSATESRTARRTNYGAEMLDGYSVANLLARNTPTQQVVSTRTDHDARGRRT